MSTEIAVRTDLTISETQTTFTDQQVAMLQQLGLEGVSEGDLAVFFHRCRVTGLDPFLNEISMIGRNVQDGGQWKKRYTVQVNVAGQRKLADRTNLYEGVTAPEWADSNGHWLTYWPYDTPPVAARAGVRRKGWPEPVVGTVMWREYAQTKKDGSLTSMWASKPAMMLAKCARAAAFREAFPVEFAGLYIEDEMPAERPVPAVQARPGDALRKAVGLPVEPVEPDVEMINDDQLKALHARFTDKGFKDRDDRLAYVREVMGFEVESSKDLTRAQASAVLNALAALDD